VDGNRIGSCGAGLQPFPQWMFFFLNPFFLAGAKGVEPGPKGAAQGPFVFPVGMWMGLGSALAERLVEAVDTEPELIQLQLDLKNRYAYNPYLSVYIAI